DIEAIGRAVNQIDDDVDQVSSSRATVGARLQGLDVTQINLEDEEVQLRAALSEQIDVDLVEAISQLTARQTSLQASLQTTANLLQLSLLNFI
ncbi:MAG: flagellin, partial [Lacipirellulaceae bacterium]